jgi:hypothetical protein
VPCPEVSINKKTLSMRVFFMGECYRRAALFFWPAFLYVLPVHHDADAHRPLPITGAIVKGFHI